MLTAQQIDDQLKGTPTDYLKLREQPYDPSEPPSEREEKLVQYRMDQRKLEHKKQFWEGLAKLQTVGSGALGLLWGRILGQVVDPIITKAGQVKAFGELETKLKGLKFKVDKVSDDEWIVEQKPSVMKPGGEKSSINPFKATEGWYAKDLGELNARMSGYDVSPEDKLFYNLGMFFGAVKAIGGVTGKAIGATSATKVAAAKAPNITRILQTGSTGLIYEAINQFQQKIEGGDFSFKTVLETGGFFALFGLGEVGLTGIANAYRMQKFFKSPLGAGLLEEGLTKAEARTMWEYQSAVARWSQYKHGKKAADAIKLYQGQDVKIPGMENVKMSELNKLIKNPPMDPATIEKVYGSRMNAIAEKLDQVKAARIGKKIGGEAPAAAEAGVLAKETDLAMREDAIAKGKKIAQQEKAIEARLESDEVLGGVTRDIEQPAPAAEAQLPENVYSSMPIEDTRALASYGVKGAQDYLVDIVDPEWFAPALEPASVEQNKKLAYEALKRGLNLDALKELSTYMTGSENFAELSVEDNETLLKAIRDYPKLDSKAIDAITSAEEPLVDMNMKAKDLQQIAKIAGDTKTFNKVINYSNMLGKAPTDPDQYKGWIDDIKVFVRSTRRYAKRVARSKKPHQEVQMINQYQSAGYALDMVERRSGYLIRRIYQEAVANVTGRQVEMENEIKNIFDAAGSSRFGEGMSFRANTLIKNWLNEADEATKAEYYRQMNAKEKALAQTFYDDIQGPTAKMVRHVRFLIWNRAAREAKKYLDDIKAQGKDPTKKQLKHASTVIKKAKPFNAPDSALVDGRIAQEIGQFDDWIATQTWGTRKDYYMHRHDLDDLLGSVEGSVPEEIFPVKHEAGTFGLKAPSAAFARKGEGSIIESDNVAMDLLRHKNRLAAFIESYDAVNEINDVVKKLAEENALTPADLGAFRMLVDTLRGIHHATPDIVKKINKGNKFFWRSYLVGDPRNSTFFGFRQLLQSGAFAPSQFNLGEVTKSMMAFPHLQRMVQWFQEEPEAREAFQKYYSAHVQESKSLYRHFLMKNVEGSGFELTGRLTTLIDILAFMPGASDRASRWMIWPIARHMADRNLKRYADGKISVDRLWKRLMIYNMPAGFSLEFRSLLRDENYAEFANRYAEYKTENVHGRYNPMLRGVQEMTPTGRTFLNLVVFPRLGANVIWKNGVEPMLSHDLKRAIAGARSILAFILGAYVIDRSVYELTGYHTYAPIQLIFGGWSIGSPGLGSTMEFFDSVSMTINQGTQRGDPPQKIALDMVKSAAGKLEDFIMIADVITDVYALQNNVDTRDVTVWKLAERMAMDSYEKDMGKKFRFKDRSARDKLVLMILGRDVIKPKENGDVEMRDLFKSKGRRSVFERN